MDVLLAIAAFLAVFGLGAVGGAVALFVLWPRVGSLERRIEQLQMELAERHTHRPVASEPPLPPRTPEPAPESASVLPVIEPKVERPAPEAPEPPAEPVVLLPAEPVVPAPEAGSVTPEVPPSTTTWEEEVGSNWLNKLGVLIVVIGLALGVSYSFARVGPVGRVALGFGLSLAMLAAGVTFARRERFRNYGHGLVAGGWAGTYFTAYAMHGIEAVRLIESPLTATFLLLAVSAGMIAHGLRYRSQTVTALTFVVGYATLSLTPLTVFALLAAVPLAVSVMIVGQRYEWTNVSVLGIGGTYGLIALRGLGVGGSLEPLSLTPAVLLAVYWATFEIADIIGHRSRPHVATQSMAALNAVGFLTTVGLVLPLDQPDRLSAYLAIMSAASLASAVARHRLSGRASEPDQPRPVELFEPHHVPLVMSAVLIVISTGLRFEGADLALRWLVEAELFVAAGLVLADQVVRRTGSAMMVLPMVAAVASSSEANWLGLADTTFVMAATAAACYVNREWLRSTAQTPATFERMYGWAGAGLLAIALDRELAGARLGVSLMAVASVLLEAGLRRAREYRAQAYAVGGLGAVLVGLFFTGDLAASEGAVWTWLSVAVLLSWGWAVRMARSPEAGSPELTNAVRGASWAGTWLLAIFEWRVVADTWLGPTLALTGAAFMAATLTRRVRDAWWQGFALVGVAGVAAWRLLEGGTPSALESAALLVVVGLMYAVTLAGPPRDQDPERSLAWPALTLLSIFATTLLSALEWQRLPDIWEEPALAATGLGLVVAGVITRLGFIRWQGYVVLFGATMAALLPVLEPNPAFDASTMAALVCVALVYAASAGGRLGLADRAGNLEVAALKGMFLAATVMLATIEWRVLPDAWAGPVKALTGLAFVGAGIAASERGLRAQGRGLLFAAAARTIGPILSASTPLPVVVAMLFVIAALYAVSLVTARLTRDTVTEAERRIDTIMSITATTLLVLLVADEVRASLVTAIWGLIGLALLVLGFPARERLLRLSGLALLALCVLKLFLYDLRELEALARIMSFVVLGLVLLVVSWGYTRFGDQIRRYL